MRMKFALPMAAITLLLAAPLRAEEPPATAHEFHVTGMTCRLCAKAIEKSLRAVDGVRDVQINREAERVRVMASKDLGADTLEAAIESAGGYRADLLGPDARDSSIR